ncbi:hypothetical protein L798_12898 [Zootermopsis nevadensis]|uniref:Uncharacterized protein n=1 Tax=Zootermopsis nevadensis TaxID=136037 RepID=A0A067QT95_ZOONE|nr:hypothetical protein L798_12898 [Zootermopsis nevadensis]
MFHGARFIFTLMCLLHAVVGDIKSMDAYSNIYENNTTPCPNCNDEAPEDDPGSPDTWIYTAIATAGCLGVIVVVIRCFKKCVRNDKS